MNQLAVLWGTVALLAALGLLALLTRRNLVQLVIGLQLLGKSAALALLVAGRAAGQPALAQSLALSVIVADTIVAVIALALIVQIKRRCGALDIRALSGLRG